MGFIKTVRGFHWITKIVIALTAILLVLIIAAAIAQAYWMSNQADQNAFNAGQGLGWMALALASILTQAFLLILVVIAIYMAAMSVKAWLEKYLNAMIAKLDMLADQKTGQEATVATLAAMNEKFTRIEKKLDSIEGILKNVGE